MAENRAARVAAGMSTAAAITAALVWINARKAQAAPPGEGFVLPEEFVQLIAVIAANTDSLDQNVLRVIDELAKLVFQVQGYPANKPGIRSFVKTCVVANQAYRGDDMVIPEGMNLLIKSYPLNPLASIVRVASTIADATNINSSYPLGQNEAVAYQVQNANQMYVSATVAGMIVVFSAEKVT